ncbi:hypothetical protein HDU67_001457 [Dinochytrium kinnereticum]|nr:hypothetical protein HDU67_001457 [Dinochytrium kinnereticum]
MVLTESDEDSDFFIPRKPVSAFPTKSTWKSTIFSPVRFSSGDEDHPESDFSRSEIKNLPSKSTDISRMFRPPLDSLANLGSDERKKGEKGEKGKRQDDSEMEDHDEMDDVDIFDLKLGKKEDRDQGGAEADDELANSNVEETDVDEENITSSIQSRSVAIPTKKRRSSSVGPLHPSLISKAAESTVEKISAQPSGSSEAADNFADDTKTLHESEENGEDTAMKFDTTTWVKMQETMKQQHDVLMQSMEACRDSIKAQEKAAADMKIAFQALQDHRESFEMRQETFRDDVIRDIRSCREVIEAVREVVTYPPTPLLEVVDEPDTVMCEREPAISLKRKVDDLTMAIEEAEKRIRLSIHEKCGVSDRKRPGRVYPLVRNVMWTVSSMVLGGALTVGLISKI